MTIVQSKWIPNSDYEVDPRELRDKALGALSNVWGEQSPRLRNLDRITERLQREWVIETGRIERLYKLDRGLTEILIEHGIKATLIPHGATENAEHTAAMIRDQQQAIEGIYAFVKGEHALTPGYIKELHSLFCRHQFTTAKSSKSMIRSA